jgi:hypothetical protein
MNSDFDASAFTARIQSGEFDGRLNEALATLTRDQLEQVALILAAAENAKSADTTQ